MPVYRSKKFLAVVVVVAAKRKAFLHSFGNGNMQDKGKGSTARLKKYRRSKFSESLGEPTTQLPDCNAYRIAMQPHTGHN